MQQNVMQTAPKPGQPVYAPQGAYPDTGVPGYQGVPYDISPTQQHGMNYTSVTPVSAADQSYNPQSVFPTPPLQPNSQPEPSPEAYSPESYGQQDLSELLGNLKVDEKGTGMFGSQWHM